MKRLKLGILAGVLLGLIDAGLMIRWGLPTRPWRWWVRLRTGLRWGFWYFPVLVTALVGLGELKDHYEQKGWAL